MRKILILFVILVFHGVVAGQKIQLSEEFSPRGGEVRIALSTTFDSLWGMSFSIDYDSTVLKYRSFVSHPDYSGQYDTLINDLSAENGQIGFQFGSLNESAELLKGDILGYFVFDVEPLARKGKYPLTFTQSILDRIVFDFNYLLLDSEYQNGAVTIFDNPDLQQDFFDTFEDVPRALDLLQNDLSVDDFSIFSIVFPSEPLNGTLSLEDPSKVVYTPKKDFNGKDQFFYALQAGNYISPPVQVEVNVRSVDDPTIFSEPLTYEIDEDNSLQTKIIVIDNDGITTANAFNLIVYPTSGVANISGKTGILSYSPNANFHGSDSLRIQVTDDDGYTAFQDYIINVRPVDDPTIISGDKEVVLDEDSMFDGVLSVIDVDGLPETDKLLLINSTNSGQLTINPITGSYTYAPDKNYYGPDSFTIQVTDNLGNVKIQMISIDVRPINDRLKLLTPQSFEIIEDVSLTSKIQIVDDADGFDPESFCFIIDNPTNGTIQLESNGDFIFVPDTNFNGNSQFKARLTDSAGFSEDFIFSIKVISIDDPIVAIGPFSIQVTEDSIFSGKFVARDDADGFSRPDRFSVDIAPSFGSLSLNESTGNYTYEPNSNYFGEDSFALELRDDDNFTQNVTVGIEINNLNDPANWNIPRSSAIELVEDSQKVFNLFPLSDVDGIPENVAVQVTLNPSNGQIFRNPGNDNQFTYVPAPNFFGRDAASFAFVDSQGSVENKSLELIVLAQDDPVTVTGDLSFTTEENNTFFGRIIAVDTLDGLSDGSYFSISKLPESGTVFINERNGQFSYSPKSDYFGQDSFIINIQDDSGFIFSQKIEVDVINVYDPPILNNDFFDIVEGDSIKRSAEFNLLTNDFSPDGSLLTVIERSTISDLGASVILFNDGTFEYDSRGVLELNNLSTGEVIQDSFTYSVTDTTGSVLNGFSFIKVTGVDYEADVAGLTYNNVQKPDNKLNLIDYLIIGEYVAKLRDIGNDAELFSRVDCSPISTRGDGLINALDWLQAAKFVIGQDARVTLGGPTTRKQSLPEVTIFDPEQPSLQPSPRRQNLSGADSPLLELVESYNETTSALKTDFILYVPPNIKAISFTVNFKKSAFSLPYECVLGDIPVQGVRAYVNDAQAKDGKIGILLSPANYASLLPAGGYLKGSITTFPISFSSETGLSNDVVDTIAYDANFKSLPIRLQLQSNFSARGKSFASYHQGYLNYYGLEHPGDFEAVSMLDTDKDGISNKLEYILGTDPITKNKIPVKILKYQGRNHLALSLLNGVEMWDDLMIHEFSTFNNSLSSIVNQKSYIKSIAGRNYLVIEANQDSGFYIFNVR